MLGQKNDFEIVVPNLHQTCLYCHTSRTKPNLNKLKQEMESSQRVEHITHHFGFRTFLIADLIHIDRLKTVMYMPLFYGFLAIAQ